MTAAEATVSYSARHPSTPGPFFAFFRINVTVVTYIGSAAQTQVRFYNDFMPRLSQPVDGQGYRQCTEIAKPCARFVVHLFQCPDLLILVEFIAYALWRTQLHASVPFAALYLLHRLKTRLPTSRSSSGQRIFIAAYMVAAKVLCDDTYLNTTWMKVAQNKFTLKEINQMERELCSHLEWHIQITPEALSEFEQKVRRDFNGQGPYPTYTLPSPAPSPVPSTTPYSATQTREIPLQTPSFATSTSTPPSTVFSDSPIPPPVPVHAGAPPFSTPSSSSASAAFLPPMDATQGHSSAARL